MTAFEPAYVSHPPRNRSPLQHISLVMPKRTDGGISSVSASARDEEGILVTVDGRSRLVNVDRFACLLATMIDRPEAGDPPAEVNSHDADELYAARLKAAEYAYLKRTEVNFSSVIDEEGPWEHHPHSEGPALARIVWRHHRGSTAALGTKFIVIFRAGSSAIIRVTG